MDVTSTEFACGKLRRMLNPASRSCSPSPILVIDAGGSSVHVVLDFGSSDPGQCSQTHDMAGTSPGGIGGSHLFNYRIRNEIIKQGKPFTEEEKAALLKNYESQKYGFDYTKQTSLLLQGGTSRAIVSLTPDFVREAFDDVFEDTLTKIKPEISLLLRNWDRLMVLFCGGTFIMSGFRQKICAHMDDETARAQVQGKEVSYAILGLCNHTWSSAVATGAAASILSTNI